jgi:hypothetical protein
MITSNSLEHLKRRFNGRLIEPNDAGYDAAYPASTPKSSFTRAWSRQWRIARVRAWRQDQTRENPK